MNSVKRRGGRPNRGGGQKAARGRGGSGGRGKRGRGGGGGHVPREKGGAGISLDDYEDFCVTSSGALGGGGGGHFTRERSAAPNWTTNDNFSGRGGGRGRFSGGNFPIRTKVPMQKLHMSTENQDLVKQALLELQGDNEDEESDAILEYDDKDLRTAQQYWMTDNKLMVEGATQFTEEESGETEFEQANKYALNKLMSYGFDKSRCLEALTDKDGDVGRCLESLISELDEDDLNNMEGEEMPLEELESERQDEKMALEAIYGDAFCERIPKQVWTIDLDLDFIKEYYRTIQASKMPEPRKKYKINVDPVEKKPCLYFQRGSCKYGNRCQYKHAKPEGDKPATNPHANVEELSKDGKSKFQLEIRFPNGNLYPQQPPILAVSTQFKEMPGYMLLNITKRLMQEAKEVADTGAPVVFSLVSLLENESEMLDVLSQPPLELSLPSVRQKGKPEIDPSQTTEFGDFEEDEEIVDFEEETENQATMEPEHKAEASKKPVRQEPQRLDPHRVKRENNRIREKFKRAQNLPAYKKMQALRKNLPAWEQQHEILKVIAENQVVVISGMTGCGKTTQVPQFILDSYLNAKSAEMCNIICTQPRRISAMAVAERVAEERADRLGGIVGYQIRLESVQSASTRLLFCTTGILLRRLEGDGLLEGVSHVIIDEVHERSEESDFLMMVLRDMLPHRKDLKVILMSATLNADLFSSYFSLCPVVHIPGKAFPVDQYFLEDAIEMTKFVMDETSPYAKPRDVMRKLQTAEREEFSRLKGHDGFSMQDLEEAAFDVPGNMKAAKDSVDDAKLTVRQLILRYPDYKKSTIRSLSLMDFETINYDLVENVLEWIVEGKHEYPKDGAVLIFLPGYAEITTLYEKLQVSSVFRNKGKYKVIPLHSILSSEDQHAVFNRPPEGITKIVIATNIAETSITIDDVVYVIDCGKMKEKRYDHTKSMESLDTVWVTRANAVQRKGRAGRVASGVCFHLFTGHRYEYQLRGQPIPEIQRVPLEQLVLKVKMLELFNVLDVKEVLYKLIEPPQEDSINSSVHRLQDLGALDVDGNLTALGYHLALLPVDVRIGKLMLFGAIFRCLDPALTIAATLSFKSPFVTPFGKKQEATEKKLEFAVGCSDHLTMLKAYKSWLSVQQRTSSSAYMFCQDNYLSVKTLQMLSSMKQQFTELLSDIGFVQGGLTARRIEKMASRGSDGVLQATGPEANCNSDNLKLVSAILCAALYPNVVQIKTPEARYKESAAGSVLMPPKPEELKFKTKDDGYINIHPSSVNFQVNYYESPYLVYHEKVKTSRVYIRDCTMVSVYPLLLFGGGYINIDLEKGNFIISLDDGWIRFVAASHEVADLVRELRMELDQLLEDKIRNPNMDLITCPRGSKIINTIVHLITTQ
ncbi:putative ATP-dependent RNA helicase DHX57 [Lingula anatina]|uniref:Putative ATP-dependent RNA helicase DHX57 n=1 Tax=Lingula anatina TaxID=7574 RepID=A0A1S3ICJ2_LINAN|nr:putative ATP-dependent RNA helicase DHX57 [Lingula anatina]XP_013395576.1 putative ATP-dependent RNA helicase DHX57 [Lingula anatina]|eukprot:XP_013395575.1 putative ATP-dependent RNA helicase DHX57 [Lingula anatina]